MQKIRKAYLEKSKQWHPDMHASSPAHCEDRIRSAEQFRLVKRAFDALRNKRDDMYMYARPPPFACPPCRRPQPDSRR